MTADGDRLLRDSLRGVLTAADNHESIGTALSEQGWAEVAAAEGDPAWRGLFEEFAVALSAACPLDLFLEPVVRADGTVTQLIYATGRTGPQRAIDSRRGRPPYARGIVRDDADPPRLLRRLPGDARHENGHDNADDGWSPKKPAPMQGRNLQQSEQRETGEQTRAQRKNADAPEIDHETEDP